MARQPGRRQKPERLDLEIDALYTLSPVEFTRARDALAKARREAGDDDAAAEVKALHRPTATAWLVNQLARAEPALVRALLDAGTDLKKAQQDVLRGRGRESLAEAQAAERRAIADLIAAASRMDGGGPGLARRLHDTLHAATIGSDEQRELLRAGRLEREIEPGSGLEDLFSGTPAPRPSRQAAPREAPSPPRKEQKERASADKTTLAQARSELSEARREALQAERQAKQAQAEAERIAERVARAEREVDELRARLEEARRAEAEARAAAEESRERVQRADAKLGSPNGGRGP